MTELVKSENDAKERTVAANEQLAANAKMTASVNAYIDALQELVKAEERAGQQRLAGMGMGGSERDLQASLSGADAKFAQEQVRLSRDQGKMSDAEYQQKLAGLVAEHSKMRDVLVANYRDIKIAESSWLLGTREGLNSFADTANNVYASLGSTVSGVFQGMSDAAVDFAMTGKTIVRTQTESCVSSAIRSLPPHG